MIFSFNLLETVLEMDFNQIVFHFNIFLKPNLEIDNIDNNNTIHMNRKQMVKEIIHKNKLMVGQL